MSLAASSTFHEPLFRCCVHTTYTPSRSSSSNILESPGIHSLFQQWLIPPHCPWAVTQHAKRTFNHSKFYSVTFLHSGSRPLKDHHPEFTVNLLIQSSIGMWETLIPKQGRSARLRRALKHIVTSYKPHQQSRKDEEEGEGGRCNKSKSHQMSGGAQGGRGTRPD